MIELFTQKVEDKYVIYIYSEEMDANDFEDVDYSTLFISLEELKNNKVLIVEDYNSFVFDDFENAKKFHNILSPNEPEHIQFFNGKYWVGFINEHEDIIFTNDILYSLLKKHNGRFSKGEFSTKSDMDTFLPRLKELMLLNILE